MFQLRLALVPALLLAAVGLRAAEAVPVAVIWHEKSGMAERVLKGVGERLKELNSPVALTCRTSLADAAASEAALAELAPASRAVVVMRSAGAKVALAHPCGKPVLFGAVGNPVELGLCSDPAKPDKGMTGVTYYLPATHSIALYRKLWPELKSVGLLVQEGHPSSAIERAETEAACAAAGLTCQVQVCADKAGVARGAAALKAAGVGLIIGGNQNQVFDNGALIAQVVGTVPYVSYSEKPVSERHALLGLVADDHALGRRLGEQIHAVAVDGRAVAEIPVAVDPAPKLKVNKAKAAAAGLSIPADMAATVQWVE